MSLSKDNRIPTVMVVGKPRNGKSNALNQIFNVDFQSRASAGSVTQGVVIEYVEKQGRKLRVIDTPGLGADDLKIDDIMPQLRSAVDGLDYIMMYCHSVAPNSTLMEADRQIMTKLHKSLGKEAWDKCVILLTFSDYALSEFEGKPKPQETYKQYLAEHIEELYTFLRSCGSDVICIRSIFQVGHEEEEGLPREITAIPVGKFYPADKLLPGVVKKKKEKWTDIAFIELMKKTHVKRRAAYFFFAYPHRVAALGALVGAGVGGAACGTAAGLVGGPAGAAVGAAVGAAAGAAVGAAIGGLGGLSIYLIRNAIN